MDDKRKTQRRRVLKAGKIIFADAKSVIDCTIRDLSPEGARLAIANTIGVPETFCLFETSTGMLYDATVTWRQAAALGVKFTTPPTNIQDPANKRFSRLKFLQ